MMSAYGIGEANATLLQNMDFETDLTGWSIGVVDPLGTWDVQWSDEYGGSAKMYITGAPAQTNVSQATQIAMESGDKITVNVFHTDMGNFSGWALIIEEPGDWQVLYGTCGAEGYDSVTWTADRVYDAGTLIGVSCSVWPGTSTTWVESLTYTPVPEPATMLFLGLGGLVLRKRRKV
ncbi:MAG: PEP-CTERM sorting domain-containing protein [Phycisphaerae bacterium]|nr:PEP-CTERM sorting domain-containing protein [Phycisphaerae bacterium]